VTGHRSFGCIAGHRVCIVSSGAVGMGCQVLRVEQRPEQLATRQALAAIGQGALMRVWTDFFSALSVVRNAAAPLARCHGHADVQLSSGLRSACSRRRQAGAATPFNSYSNAASCASSLRAPLPGFQ
jgi:hypothetical protein